MSNLFNLMQNISRLINFKSVSDFNLKKFLICPAHEYNMDHQSLFLDIGSGFGKPVFHAAFQVGCESKGIEVVPARVEFCIDFFYEFLESKPFFEELEKKLSSKQVTNNCDDEETNPNSRIQENSQIKKSNLVSENVKFINNINLNSLNCAYYEDIIKDNTCNLFLEIRINPDIIFDESYINLINSSMKNKINQSILLEHNDDILNINKIKYGNYFMTDVLNVNITPIDDLIYSTLNKSLTNVIYTDRIEREIFYSLKLFKYDKIRNISVSEIIAKIENPIMLDLITYVNVVFGGKICYLESKKTNSNITCSCLKCKQSSCYDENIYKYCITQSDKNLGIRKNPDHISNYTNHNDKNDDLYEKLRDELNMKEIMIEQLHNEEQVNSESEIQIFKEILADFKICQYSENWYKKTSFIADDATNYKFYSNDSKQHFTHIYSYNKLMSKECRSKIANVLNKTKFKLLAWYSNPKQTKKAGLKNFIFLCKFPMQSTSTEKFHVYVYLKTK